MLVLPVKFASLAVLFLAVPISVAAQDLPDWVKRTRISGLAFGDTYWMAANHDSVNAKGANGIWIRRAYLTVDNKLSDKLDFRFRLEGNSPGDFKTSSNMVPFVKDLWVRWTTGRHQVVLGISPSPTWEVLERIWGYRDVEKTPLDLLRLGTSRDFGLAVLGPLDKAGKVRYHLMVGNGNDTRADADHGKKALLALGFQPTKSVLLEGYADYEGLPGDTDRYMLQLFSVVQGSWGRVGLQYTRQHRDGPTDLDLDLVSGFLVAKATEKVTLLARLDRMFDPNPDGPKIPYLPFAATAKSTFLLAGVDLTLDRRFHLIPNLETVFYDGVASGAKPDADVMLRTTFSFTF